VVRKQDDDAIQLAQERWRDRHRHGQKLAIILSLCFAAATSAPCLVHPSCAGENGSEIRQLRSKQLILRTDLPRRRARRLLERLEAKLRVFTRYWERPIAQPIECFIVADLSNWKEGTLPADHARLILERIGGYAYRASSGRVSRAFMFARDEPNVAQHELVHAYCLAAFPNSGPDWYKEGMAEYFSYASDQSHAGLRCHDKTIAYLQQSEPRSIKEIIANQRLTASIADSVIRAAYAQADDTSSENSGWGLGDDAMLLKAHKSYSWSWALCHFLVSNSNYSNQFRKLGQAYLAGDKPQFDEYFADCRGELEAEFRHFASRIDRGYRVDLCRWNWRAESVPLPPGEEADAHVHAGRGFQASGLILSSSAEYAFATTGKWQIDPSGPAFNSDGQLDGAGQLVGAVFTSQQMSEPIELGSSGRFIAPHDGTLYLRCRDEWHTIADNHGTVKVRIKRLEPIQESRP
jgi:hypothetical protein